MSGSVAKLDFEKPIVRESVAEMVAHRILEMVKSGALKPGDQLPPERDLAQSLHVSRPSVREAIRGLSILGVVNVRQGGGAYISALDAEALLGPIQFFISLEELNIRELYDARSLIESDVARRAAERITDEEIVTLEAIYDEQIGLLDDAIAFRMSDYRFHEAIWSAARNAFLMRIGKSLNVLGLEFRKRASETQGVLQRSLADHRVLLDALKARDPDAASAAASRHMSNVYRSTIRQKDIDGEQQ
ncbi:MAG: FadR family transcriptional regulator [Roseitalea sp.]|jgi:DNA-binding FadR family transcriptional regulator|nr:FadR family transcriptional regulator [Roseitalea sp.]MBO6721394.1 FadR family transcriptional regulator [Roseitalea sp.]MBO6744579.1 FadR family transcriptional regulator [Roseitalea sp.]